MYCLAGWAGLVRLWDPCEGLFEGATGCNGVAVF